MMRTSTLFMAALVALLVVAAPSPSLAQQQIQTRVVDLPAGTGTSAKVEVHVRQDMTRMPNEPPRVSLQAQATLPPGMSAPAVAAAVAAANGRAAAAGGMTAGGMTVGSTGLIMTPGASLQGLTTPLTNGFADGPAMQMGYLNTAPGVKIVANLDNKCGCPSNNADPCDNPCAPAQRGLADEIESRLLDVKSQIVDQATKLKNDREWVARVQDIIKHYDAKIRAVQQDQHVLEGNIRKLFDKKKQYDDLLLKARINKDAFRTLAPGDSAAAIPTLNYNSASSSTTTSTRTREYTKEITI